MSIAVRVQHEDFSVADEYQALVGSSDCGAVVTFTGLVRELAEGGLQALHLEHYSGMTEQVLEQVARQAQQRWQVEQLTIVHRIGNLALNEQIVFVGVASPHRCAGFEACMFVMDFLKTQAPFWKREETSSGSAWVAAKATDQVAAERWQVSDVSA
ncbi:molybdopterin synthase catalytic subunit MoaE [Pseudidiomarina homiensis]|uniref:Molybdopterin synthase catalytic subunit n=1 Tax=Pseudidiomarina homiensis TaxID=364198 RepID=A0A432XX88_9GAMM|nr:molybdopterin synthase catalytic subunit MoaE [Pseudidiomarina homiensis]RUO53375.1 molybdopterin synthase catalytic subunit MoaE [Pseudidiomarina homiensis]